MKTLLQRVREKSVDVGDCWEWRGATQTKSTTPIVNYGGKAVSVVRALALDAGAKLDGLVATNRCRNPACVNPEHVVAVPRSMLITMVSQEQQFQKRLDFRHRLSRSSWKRKLSDSDVNAIRTSDADRQTLAQQYGVTRSYINSLKSGHRRALATTNVFAGLLA